MGRKDSPFAGKNKQIRYTKNVFLDEALHFLTSCSVTFSHFFFFFNLDRHKKIPSIQLSFSASPALFFSTIDLCQFIDKCKYNVPLKLKMGTQRFAYLSIVSQRPDNSGLYMWVDSFSIISHSNSCTCGINSIFNAFHKGYPSLDGTVMRFYAFLNQK